ncbi:protein mono-ADP-ribosyltransferase PARP12-like [Watersipora subatra]|uniref:protein mono-ADP-ribosyltransferase PARP12-like n=1 Tax=Watersipora subatra TaxID=2589382 RepID=UPI00355C9885
MEEIRHFEILKHIDVGVRKFEISSTSQEYRNVLEQLGTGMDHLLRVYPQHLFNVNVKISRIENLILLAQYEAQKRKVEWLLATEKSTLPAERKLFHVTSKTAADKICEEEYNRSFAGSVYGTTLGSGTYFGTGAAVAAYRGECIFMAKVLTGKFYKGDSSVSGVNLSPKFHSTVNNVKNPTVFVVYHDAAAYPEYLIEVAAASINPVEPLKDYQ